MSQKIKLTVVNGTENCFKLVLSTDGVIITHTNIINAALRTLDGLTLADSEVDPTDWDFTDPGFVIVKLGLTELPGGLQKCILIVKDASNPTGLAWDRTELHLTVVPKQV